MDEKKQAPDKNCDVLHFVNEVTLGGQAKPPSERPREAEDNLSLLQVGSRNLAEQSELRWVRIIVTLYW